jgi:ATP-dependent helicase/DNAse subunit B
MQWLEVDAKRPTPFSVVESEERRKTEFAGIAFHYIIDRLDMLDDGRTVIIDYKTGEVAKRDWQGDRIRKPQLPLYALAVEQLKQRGTSGIAYAKVKQHDCKYEELAEVNIFNKELKRTLDLESKWHESKAAWPEIFAQLAADFLAGNATVNPIDEATCSYCELQPVCRVSQLRDQSEAGQ